MCNPRLAMFPNNEWYNNECLIEVYHKMHYLSPIELQVIAGAMHYIILLLCHLISEIEDGKLVVRCYCCRTRKMDVSEQNKGCKLI